MTQKLTQTKQDAVYTVSPLDALLAKPVTLRCEYCLFCQQWYPCRLDHNRAWVVRITVTEDRAGSRIGRDITGDCPGSLASHNRIMQSMVARGCGWSGQPIGDMPPADK